jgi:membrane-associated phospholipid phosphatase
VTRDDNRLFGLPEPGALWINLLLSIAFAAYFWIVYWLGDFVAARATERFHVALSFELLIPFVPWAAVVYLTVTPLLCLAPFIFRTPERLLPLFVTLCAEVTIAGAIFCILPVELSFAPQEVTSSADVFLRLAHAIALTYNCVPSLHVALAVSAAWAYAPAGGWRWRILVWSWAAAIVVSTLLTHQHHLADLAGGVLLSAVCMRYLFPRVRKWLEARSGQDMTRRQGAGA